MLRHASPHTVALAALVITSTLATASGRAASGDYVCQARPRHPSGAVALVPDAGQPRLVVDLAALADQVDRVLVIATVGAGTLADAAGVQLSVQRVGGAHVALYALTEIEPVAAAVLGEFYRRAGRWKFRAVGQGWASGLTGLAEEFGLPVADVTGAISPAQTHAPAHPATSVEAVRTSPGGPQPQEPRADWYPDASAPSTLRWWDGTGWTAHLRALPSTSASHCGRCGQALRRRPFSPARCVPCEAQVPAFLAAWRSDAEQILFLRGPFGPQWDALWPRLRFAAISEELGREALRPVAVNFLTQIERQAVATATTDDAMLDLFDQTAAALGVLTEAAVAESRARLHRARQLADIRDGGHLPRIGGHGLHLEIDERVHLDIHATSVRYLTHDVKRAPGRLLVSNRKIRFLGPGGTGAELGWAKVVDVRRRAGAVEIVATTGRGGGIYEVADPDYAEAVLYGALGAAKRLAPMPGQRDTRTIPQHVKAEVFHRDGGACTQCGAREFLEFDHVIPHSKGGATSTGNLQLLCRPCNSEKSARI